MIENDLNLNRYGNAVVDFSKALQPLAVQAFFSTRKGGVSVGPYASFNLSTATGDSPEAVKENLEILRQLANRPKRWLTLSQVHGDVIVVDDGVMDGPCGEADGLVSRYKDVALSTYHADCYPIFMACSKSGVMGLAHAGWQGVCKEIAVKLVEHMKNQGACVENIRAVIGPGISKKAYQVSEGLAEDFKGYFGKDVVDHLSDGSYLDLVQCLMITLKKCGLKGEHITVSGYCTASEADLFYSHRRDGQKTGRMMAVLARR